MQPNLIEHLTVFIVVAERGSFSAAAAELGRAVSSVSYAMAQVEAYCGFALLDRKPRGVILTERGRALYSEAKTVVERARRFASRARALELGEETRIRIAVDVLFPIRMLHDALTTFARQHSNVRIQFFAASFNSAWEDLRNGKADFALGLLAALPLDMEGRSFDQITLSPAAAADHPLSRRTGPLTLADFASERQIYYVGSYELEVERAGRTFSSDLWTANDLEHIRLMIRRGFGWSFATDHFFDDEVRTGTIRLLHCQDAQLHPVRSLGVAWPGERQPGPLSRKLIGLIEGVASSR
ncbi:LysR family transcriptional regulator [Microbaculum sp. FT89]|uniref:LysR family transcriptional regulator n=1 Tax=Microbaculum sp. FT89 TaxID=3447298 RepID=UPI003F52FCDB